MKGAPDFALASFSKSTSKGLNFETNSKTREELMFPQITNAGSQTWAFDYQTYIELDQSDLTKSLKLKGKETFQYKTPKSSCVLKKHLNNTFSSKTIYIYSIFKN